MCICLLICMCTMCKPGVRGGQKRGQIPWDWSYTTTWMLGVEQLEEGESPRNSERSDRLSTSKTRFSEEWAGTGCSPQGGF